MGSTRATFARGLATAAVLCLVALALLVANPAAARAGSFADVRGDEWFAEAVQVLSDNGIVQGSANGLFRPYDSITRAEYAVFVSRALGLSPGVSHPFTDIPAGAWYEPAVAALFQAGLADGISSTEFAPNAKLSRQQAASFVIRALAYSLNAHPLEGLDLALTPIEIASWLQGFPDRIFIAATHQAAVANAYRLQVISGQADGRFYPLADLTRAQSAGMLYVSLFKTPSPLPGPHTLVPTNPVYPDTKVGSKGPQVTLLEQRLTDLSYRPGPIDGVFDERTRQAVIAFQKWEGLSRDGVVGQGTWARLLAAGAPTASRSGTGVWIEVSLTKQVFLYVDNGTVTRTLPTSTGRNFTYQSAPYTVERKAIPDGPRYRALYLIPGSVLAIHGYHSVPIFPASDGCIRLPKWDMDDLRATDNSSPMIPDGTKVYVY